MNVLFASPLGALPTRPWVDRVGLFSLLRAATPAARLAKWPGSATLHARVVEPVDQAPTEILIVGSGLCLETELPTVRRDASRLLEFG